MIQEYGFTSEGRRINNYYISFITEYTSRKYTLMDALLCAFIEKLKSTEAKIMLKDLYKPQIKTLIKRDSNKIVLGIDIEMLAPKYTFEKDNEIIKRTIEYIMQTIKSIEKVKVDTAERSKSELDQIYEIIEDEYIYKEPVVIEKVKEIEFSKEEIIQLTLELQTKSEIKIVSIEEESVNFDFETCFANNKESDVKYVLNNPKKKFVQFSEVQEKKLESIKGSNIIACVYGYNPSFTPKLCEMQIIKSIINRKLYDKIRKDNNLAYAITPAENMELDYITFNTEIKKENTDEVIRLFKEVKQELNDGNITNAEFDMAYDEYAKYISSGDFLEQYILQLKYNIAKNITIRSFGKKQRKIRKVTLDSVKEELKKIKQVAIIKFVGAE